MKQRPSLLYIFVVQKVWARAHWRWLEVAVKPDATGFFSIYLFVFPMQSFLFFLCSYPQFQHGRSALFRCCLVPVPSCPGELRVSILC